MPSIHQDYLDRCSTPSDIVEHLGYLHDLCTYSQATTVVELGVRTGNSTAAFLAAMQTTGGHLWSVDIAYPDVPEHWRGDWWTLIVGNDLEVGAYLPDRIDVLFIDTSHHYGHTLAELDLYGPRSTRIVLHDTELEHPYQAPVGDPPFPVHQATVEWATTQGRNVEFRRNCWGLATIHPPR